MAKIRHIVSKIALFSSILAFVACSNPLTVASVSRDNDMRSAKSSDQLNFIISGGDYGVTEPSGELTYKVGTSYDISFTENDSYQFEKWEVLNASTGKPVNDVIKIEEIKEPDTQITVLRAADNILLRPVCKLRPKMLSTIPDYKDAGVYRDSVIIVTFDSEISEESFYYSAEEQMQLEADSFLRTDDDKVYGYVYNDVIYYKNLKISSKDNVNLLDFFEPPVIENGTIIKIKPKTEKTIISSIFNYLDIDVCLSPEIMDINGVSIGAKGVQWRYRINSFTDTNPPEFTKFALAKTQGLLRSSIASDLLIPGKLFNPLNHVQDTLYYNCEGNDEESGISYLKLVTQRIQDAAGLAVDDAPVSEILENLEGSVVLQNNDGLILATFTLYDLSGNASKTVQQYLIAKDTTVDLTSCHLYNKNSFVLEDKITADMLNETSRTICWNEVSDDIWFKENKTPAQDLSYTLFWGYNPEKLVNRIECQKELCFNDGLWSVNLPDLDSSKNAYFKLSVTDAVGNENSITAEMLACPSYFTYQKVSDGGEYSYKDIVSGKEKTIPYPAHYRIFTADSDASGYLYYLYDDEEELKTQSFLNLNFNANTLLLENTNQKYFDIYTEDISKCRFFYQSVCHSETFTESQEMESELFKLQLKIQSRMNSDAFLKDLEAYNPDLRNTYLILKARGLDDDAEKLVTGFYLWNYLVKYQQETYYSTILFSTLAGFTVTESETLTAPQLNSIKITKGNINSGVNKAVIKYSSSAPYGAVYGFFWGKSESEIVNFENTEEFNIESGISTLYFKTAAIDTKTGESIIGPVSVYDLSDYAFDTAAPKIDGFDKCEVSQNPNEYRASEYYPVVTCEICWDDYEVTDGLAQYTLYVVPAESPEQTFSQLSEETIRSSSYLVNTFTPPTTKYEKAFVWNNVEGLGTAEMYFYVIYLQDASGNYSYTPLTLSKQLMEKVPVVSFNPNKEDEDLVDIKFDIEKELGYRNYQFEYNIYDTSESEITYYPCQDLTAAKDSFFFAYAKAVYQVGQLSLTKFSYPVYFYSGNEKCELKDVIDGMNGAQIYCDRPCLVMTYWSSENYGYEIQDWEAFGVQTNVMYISAKNPVTEKYEETLKYYTVNYDEIPMGKYFVVIAHFADGTALMTRKINTN